MLEIIFTQTIKEVVSTFVTKLFSLLGIKTDSDEIDEKEKKKRIELIHLLARSHKQQVEKADELDEEKEHIEEKLEQQKRVLDLMERNGYDRRRLIERYRKDAALSVLLIAAADKTDENSYLKDKLDEEYNSESVTGALKIIPPEKIPKEIESDEDIEDWIEMLVENQPNDTPPSGIFFATMKDLHQIYSEVDTNEFDMSWTTVSEVVDNVLTVDDMQGLINAAPISPADLILDGDLLFLAKGALPSSEMNKIDQECQKKVMNDLNDPNLRTLAQDITEQTLASSLKDFTDTPEKTASALLEEAEDIHEQLRDSESITTLS
jgi:hypothetical protein